MLFVYNFGHLVCEASGIPIVMTKLWIQGVKQTQKEICSTLIRNDSFLETFLLADLHVLIFRLLFLHLSKINPYEKNIKTVGVIIQNKDISVMNMRFSFHCNVQDVPYDSKEYEPHPVSGTQDHNNPYTYGNIIVTLNNFLLDKSEIIHK